MIWGQMGRSFSDYRDLAKVVFWKSDWLPALPPWEERGELCHLEGLDWGPQASKE